MRDDLAHLTPEALTQLTNAGLVKRAMRELAAGERPQVALDDMQTLHARFADGTECIWPSSTAIQNARCSCGAAGVCRHRLIAVLAYREGLAAAPQAEPAPVREVGNVSDDELARMVPAAALQAAERTLLDGIAIDVRRRASGEPCDTARLPNASVRFWAGGAIEAARCDCRVAGACEHVVLGVWAFRAAQKQHASEAIVTVRLGPPGRRHALDTAPFELAVQALLQHGVVQGSGALAQGFTAARAASSGAAWLTLLTADLETWAEAYAQRSALYEAGDGLDLVAELGLRLAAGRLPGHAGAALGIGLAGESALDRLRLMSLGARTRRDGERRLTTIVVADVDTGTRFVLNQEWEVPVAREAEEPRLRAATRVAPGVLLEAMAQGQLLAQQATRLADGSIRLARARGSQNSVLPQAGDWLQLTTPLRFDSVAALRAEALAHPHAALQARHAARRYVVFSPHRVAAVHYDANEQSLVSVLADGAEETLLVQRTHERHAAHALDAIAAALGGRFGALRHVAGTLGWQDGVPCIEPWALACDRLVVPDFSGAVGALPDVALGRALRPVDSACARLIDDLRRHLATALHHGTRRLPHRWWHEGEELASALAAAGLQEMAERIRAFRSLLEAERTPTTTCTRAFMTLAALRQLHQDAIEAQSCAIGQIGPEAA